MTVVHLVPDSAPLAPSRGDRLLAALIILTDGVARVGKTAVYAAVLLLAAIGAVSLLGR
jgi:hypothetical protein